MSSTNPRVQHVQIVAQPKLLHGNLPKAFLLKITVGRIDRRLLVWGVGAIMQLENEKCQHILRLFAGDGCGPNLQRW